MSVEQMELPLGAGGEASGIERGGEAGPTARDRERLGADDLMDRIVARSNLARAFKRVRQNQGSAGSDGMTVDELGPCLRDRWPVIREQLLAGTYQPSVVRPHQMPKAGGGMRTLGIPTVSTASSSRPCYRSRSRSHPTPESTGGRAGTWRRGGSRTLKVQNRQVDVDLEAFDRGTTMRP
jgi:hypothetical protein